MLQGRISTLAASTRDGEAGSGRKRCLDRSASHTARPLFSAACAVQLLGSSTIP